MPTQCKHCLASSAVLLLFSFVAPEASGFSIHRRNPNVRRTSAINSDATSLVALFAMPSGASTANQNPRTSKNTARESAFLAEWEPVSELQRRIDEGANYEHWPEDEGTFGQHARHYAKQSGSVPSVRGVFCGYRVTDEEYGRLRSADPDAP